MKDELMQPKPYEIKTNTTITIATNINIICKCSRMRLLLQQPHVHTQLVPTTHIHTIIIQQDSKKKLFNIHFVIILRNLGIYQHGEERERNYPKHVQKKESEFVLTFADHPFQPYNLFGRRSSCTYI